MRLGRTPRTFLGCLLAMAAVSALPILAWSDDALDGGASTQPDAELAAQLTAIDAKAGAITDLTAHFEQQKFTEMLKEPLVSSGSVRAHGDEVRWDTEAPDPSVLYTDGKDLRLYYPSQNLEEIYPLDQRLADLLASPLPRLSAIRGHFAIVKASPEAAKDLPLNDDGGETLALRLTPTDQALKEHVQEVIVVLDTQSGVVRGVQTTDADGGITRMSFSDEKIDTGIKPGELTLVVPAGTSVSHPLGDSGADTGQGK